MDDRHGLMRVRRTGARVDVITTRPSSYVDRTARSVTSQTDRRNAITLREIDPADVDERSRMLLTSLLDSNHASMRGKCLEIAC